MQAAERLELVRQGRLVIAADMDGTMTDPEAMDEIFTELYTEKVAELLRAPVAECRLWLTANRAHVLMYPQHFNWQWDNHAVAPGTSDYMLLNQSAARRMLEGFLAEGAFEWALKSSQDIDGILNQAFAYAHEQTPPRFRNGAREFVQFAEKRGGVVFVTNSKTVQVEQRLQLLLPGNEVPVMGDARKMVIDPAYDELASPIRRPGFDRDIDVRRPHYHQTLTREIPRRFGENGGLVLGDVPELDLMIPEQLGWWTVLMTSQFTPEWEQTYYDTLETGFKAVTLYQVLEWLEN